MQEMNKKTTKNKKTKFCIRFCTWLILKAWLHSKTSTDKTEAKIFFYFYAR